MEHQLALLEIAGRLDSRGENEDLDMLERFRRLQHVLLLFWLVLLCCVLF